MRLIRCVCVWSLLVLLVQLIVACDKSESNEATTTLALGGDCWQEPVLSPITCANFIQDFCEKVEVDQIFRLPDSVGNIMPYSCAVPDDSIVFRDNEDNHTVFSVRSIMHTIAPKIVESEIPCSQAIDEALHFCIYTESFALDFEAALLGKPISLILSKEFSHPVTDDLNSHEEIVIRTTDFNADTGEILWVNHFSHSTEVMDVTLQNIEYYPTIELNGQSFEEVHSWNYPELFVPEHFNKFYYTFSEGIVGFEDNQGKTWSIVL